MKDIVIDLIVLLIAVMVMFVSRFIGWLVL